MTNKRGNFPDYLRIPYKSTRREYWRSAIQRLQYAITPDNRDTLEPIINALTTISEEEDKLSRINDVELEQWTRRRVPLPQVTGCLAGAVSLSETPPYGFRKDTTIVEVVAFLGTAGSSDTTIVINKNGSATSPTLTLGNGVASNILYYPQPIAFKADQDVLSFEVTTAGSGASDLTVVARGI